MTPEIRELLNQYRALWHSYLTSPDEALQRSLIETMEQIRDRASLSYDVWEEFTETLPGFEEWWGRVRGEHLDRLAGFAALMETEE